MDFVKNLIKKQPTYFLQAKEMLLDNYIKYLETNDLRYFTDYHNKKNVKEPRTDLLEKSMTAIYGEILEITKRFEVLERFRKTHKIMKMRVKYSSVYDLIMQIYDYDYNLGRDLLLEKVEMLGKWGYKVNKNKELFSELERIANGLKAYKQEIDILEDELQKENHKEKSSFEKERLSVEMGLDLKIPIDPMKDSVERWFLLLMELEKKAELLNRKDNGKSN